jgi:L-amino acid N-acyltransferase YncA
MVEAWKRRQAEAKARGARHFYLIATLEGEIAGYTHCVIYDTDPTFVTQGMTAVPQKFRNRGLGKLLKAKMLVHLKNDAPEVRVVRTTNNDLNAPMVSINDRLGFIKGATFTSFAFDISKAVEALKPKA